MPLIFIFLINWELQNIVFHKVELDDESMDDD